MCDSCSRVITDLTIRCANYKSGWQMLELTSWLPWCMSELAPLRNVVHPPFLNLISTNCHKHDIIIQTLCPLLQCNEWRIYGHQTLKSRPMSRSFCSTPPCQRRLGGTWDDMPGWGMLRSSPKYSRQILLAVDRTSPGKNTLVPRGIH